MAVDDQMRRSSLYVGDLHPEVTEKDLIRTFSQMGLVLSVRLCRDKFSGKSLCYAYVNFWLPCYAFNALKCLNHTILRGKCMRIMWYERNPTARKNGIGNLYVKNLDKSITGARLQKIFSKYGTILSCKVVEENGISKGFGFVQFDSEESAMEALGGLHDTELEGKKLYVSKFRRKIEMKDSNLIVKNLDLSVDAKKLEKLFSGYGRVISAKVFRSAGVSSGFGFVCFSSIEDAKKALISLSGADFEGRVLHVKVAQPKEQKTSKLCNSYERFSPQPFYSSYNQQPSCNFPHFSSPIPFTQPRQWLPTLYQHFVSPFNSYNLFQAQNFRWDFYASPMQLDTLNEYVRAWHLEMSKGQINCNALQGKITNGNGKEFCKGSGAVNTFGIRSSQEIHKIKPDYMYHLQGQKSSTRLLGKLINGDRKELCNGAGSMITHYTGLSSEFHKT